MRELKVGQPCWYEPTGEEGTIIEVDKDHFCIRWELGGETTESFEDSHNVIFENLESELNEETVKEYLKAIENKYPEESDAVNPKHYDLFPEYGIQVREVMEVLCDKLDKQGYSGFLCSDYVQAMQYFLRWFEKNGAEDIEKGIWYMEKIIQQVEGKENT